MFKKNINILVVLILFCGGLFSSVKAQTLTATAEATQVAVGQEFQIEYSVNAVGSGFSAPSFEGFNVQGPMTGQSTQMNLMTGSSSTTMTFTYALVPKAEGTYTIGAASIKCGGKTISSNSLTIKVTKGAPPQQNTTAQAQKGNSKTSVDTRNVLLKLIPNKTKVYEGEELTVTTKLYTRLSIENNQVIDAPDFSGFYAEDVPQNAKNQLPNGTEVVNGLQYDVYVFQQKVLFPQHSGKIKIKPITVQFLVDQPVKNNSFIGQIFGGGYSYQRVPVNISSEAVTIDVLPLPKTKEKFSGAVGDLTLKGELDKSNVKANEAINLTVTLSGSGSLKLIDTLPFQFPADFDHYDPKITDHLTIGSTGVSGSRTFNYLLIPRHPGAYKIPSVDFTYFNTKKKDYVKLSLPDMDIQVTKGDNNSSSVTISGNVNKEDVKVIGSDIRYIHTGHETYYRVDDFFLYSVPFFAGILAPILAFIGFVVGRKRYIDLRKDTVALKKRGATRMAKKRLKTAHKNMLSGNKEVFYAELLNALNGYFSDKFAIPLADLSRDTISTNLTLKNIKQETLQMVNKAIDDCEFAHYAPATITGNLQEVYDSAVKLLTILEDEIS